MAKCCYLTLGAPSRSTPRTMYTKLAYGGNTSAIVGKPLSREQLKKLLGYLVEHSMTLDGGLEE